LLVVELLLGKHEARSILLVSLLVLAPPLALLGEQCLSVGHMLVEVVTLMAM